MAACQKIRRIQSGSRSFCTAAPCPLPEEPARRVTRGRALQPCSGGRKLFVAGFIRPACNVAGSQASKEPSEHPLMLQGRLSPCCLHMHTALSGIYGLCNGELYAHPHSCYSETTP